MTFSHYTELFLLALKPWGQLRKRFSMKKNIKRRIPEVGDSIRSILAAGVNVGDVIDVGIQHGTPMLKYTFPDKHHFLFEPVEEYYSIIRKEYENLSYTLVEAAVSEMDGTLRLKTERKTGDDTISHSHLTSSLDNDTREVQTVSLDTYFGRNSGSAPYFLKIDVEGPTVPTSILKGARKVLSNTAIVMIEMTVDRFMERSIILHEAGFDLWDICDLCYYREALWQVDAIFISRKLKNENINLRPMHKTPFDYDIWYTAFDTMKGQ